MATGKKYIFVIAGGPLGDNDFFRAEVARFGPAALVCADGGARHLDALAMAPEVIIGDMDSLPPEFLEQCAARGCRIIRHPRTKKETDTQLALEYAWKLLPHEVRVYGSMGARLDHTLANIFLLAAAKQGVATKLVDEWCEVFLVTKKTVIEGTAGQTVSLFPLSAPVEGINLEGFAYPLSGGTMEIGAPYGISNLLLAERAVISVASGSLLVVKYHHPDRFPGSI